MSETVRDTTNLAEATADKLIDTYGFKSAFKTKYAEVLVQKDQQIIACILLEDYIPIKYFKETFDRLGKLIEENGSKKFIFDKRALRTFHQPSMEWYYIKWKAQMLSYGLVHHRKILPDLRWFVKAVEIAKRPLLAKIPVDIIRQLDISYCDTIDEAVAR